MSNDDNANQRPAALPSAAELRSVNAGAETVVADHVASSFRPSPSKRLFWVNLVILLALSIVGTLWFKEHLEPYVTQILLVGGSLTIWAAIRLLWAIVEKMTKIDPWDQARSKWSSPAITRFLLVIAVAQGVLWFSSASLYFEHAGAGAGEREYVVRVTRKPEQVRFVDDVTIATSAKLNGAPYFWGQANTPLECRIISPPAFEALDCSLHAGQSTRIKVPGSFEPKDLRLLRLVPAGMTYVELPAVTDTPSTHHRLEMNVEGKTYVLDNVRKQTIYLGGVGDDMDLAYAIEKSAEFGDQLSKSLRAAQLDDATVQQVASVLTTNIRKWDAIRVKPGQKITLSMRWSKTENGKEESDIVKGFPIVYAVTSEKVQTVWLPPL